MNMNEIIQKREELDNQLNIALSTMEKKDTIQKIRLEILKNQRQCPHYSTEYNWVVVDGVCPYCGFKLQNEERSY